ncbi:MAG: ATP-binding protein [Waddliaceae bacterium]
MRNTPSYPILRLFKEDFIASLSIFESHMEVIQAGSDSPLVFNSIASAFQATKSAAKIAKLSILEKISTRAEAFFQQMASRKEEMSSEQLSLFHELQKELSSLAEVETEHLLSSIDKKEALLKTFDQKIQEWISTEKMGAPPREISEHEALLPSQVVEAPKETELYRALSQELQSQVPLLLEKLVAFEDDMENTAVIDALMRVVHSLKGSCRSLNLTILVDILHRVEECFVSFKEKKVALETEAIDFFFEIADFLKGLSTIDPMIISPKLEKEKGTLEAFRQALDTIVKKEPLKAPEIKEEIKLPPDFLGKKQPKERPHEVQPMEEMKIKEGEKQELTFLEERKFLKISSKVMNRLLGLAGETVVQSHWLKPFEQSLFYLWKQYTALISAFRQFENSVPKESFTRKADFYFSELQERASQCSDMISKQLVEFRQFLHKQLILSDHLYQEVVESRMCPFSEEIPNLSHLVRNARRKLDKKVKLKVIGKETLMDREVLEKLRVAFAHLLANAVDHGIEFPQHRVAAGKPEIGTITIELNTRAESVIIKISDDGRGIDKENISQKILEKQLANPEELSRMPDEEIFDFLFLSGFSTSAEVSKISGRGVGLDILFKELSDMNGKALISSKKGEGTTIELEVPLTLSVSRVILVEISGDIYGFPLGKVEHTLLVPKEEVHVTENRRYVHFEGENIGIIPAFQVLECPPAKEPLEVLPLILLRTEKGQYGVLVDKLLGEKELVLQDLEKRLGKIPDVKAGALTEDGHPVLVLDVDMFIASVDQLLARHRPEDPLHSLRRTHVNENKDD